MTRIHLKFVVSFVIVIRKKENQYTRAHTHTHTEYTKKIAH